MSIITVDSVDKLMRTGFTKEHFVLYDEWVMGKKLDELYESKDTPVDYLDKLYSRYKTKRKNKGLKYNDYDTWLKVKK